MKKISTTIKIIINRIYDEYFALSEDEDIRHLELQNRMLTRVAMLGWALWAVDLIIRSKK